MKEESKKIPSVKRLKTESKWPRATHKTAWPKTAINDTALFERRASFRKMRIMVDGDIMPDLHEVTDKITEEEVFRLLLQQQEFIELYRYNVGPPEGVRPIRADSPLIDARNNVYNGWAIVYPYENNHWPVSYSAESSSPFGYGGITGNLHEAVRGFNSTTYNDLPDKDADVAREKDMVALRVASEVLSADIFITNRPFLREGNLLVRKYATTVCSMKEAISIISLYLRAQDVFVIATGSQIIRLSYKRSMFYWAGAQELLPESWRWSSAFAQVMKRTNDNTLAALSHSVLRRIMRALRQRDRIHISLSSPSSDETVEDALENLDSLLITLMGALDATARVAHKVLQIPKSANDASWHRDGWLNKVEKQRPGFTSFVVEGTENYHTLELLTSLRNTVHEVALTGAQFVDGEDDKKVLIVLTNIKPNILVAMDALGSNADWGYFQAQDAIRLIDPGILADKLFASAVRLLNEIMKKLPVEELDGVVITDSDKKRPIKDTDKLTKNLSEWECLSVRWQLGF